MNNLTRLAATTTIAVAVAMTAIAAGAQGIPGAVSTPSAEPATPPPAAAAPADAAPAAPAATAPAAALSPAAVAEAQAKWQNLCSTCHGALGKGDGPAGMALQPRPRDLSNAAWQAEKTDAHIEKVILEGGHAVGLSVLMPANPDLASKPEVIKALRAHVRSLAGK
jgi:mono/diheme cytochrome c family protein